MRINIYNDEVTGEITIVEKYAQAHEAVFVGARMFLTSREDASDDDKDALTFWVSSDGSDWIGVYNAMCEMAQRLAERFEGVVQGRLEYLSDVDRLNEGEVVA